MDRYDMHTYAFEEVQNAVFYVVRLGYTDLVKQLHSITSEIIKRRNEEVDNATEA